MANNLLKKNKKVETTGEINNDLLFSASQDTLKTLEFKKAIVIFKISTLEFFNKQNVNILKFKNCFICAFLGWNLKKAIVIFEINPLLHGVFLHPILHGLGHIFTPWYLMNDKLYEDET